jgi:hypothetical protein
MAVHIAFLRFRSVGRPTLDCAWLSVALILCQYVLYIYLRLFSMSIGFRYCHRYSTRTRTYVQYHPPKSSASTVTSPVDTSCKSCILKVPTPPPIRDPRQHPWHSLLVGRTPRTLSASTPSTPAQSTKTPSCTVMSPAWIERATAAPT